MHHAIKVVGPLRQTTLTPVTQRDPGLCGELPPDVEMFRFGEGTGTLCGGDSDFFSVRVDQGERVRVRLVFDDAENLDLTLSGDAIDEPIVAATENVPEQIIFPDADAPVQNATTYFIEVRGAGGRQGTAYTVEVTVAPREQPCFPDRLDEAGDDTFQTANQIGGLQRYEQRLLSVCPRRDEDWFTLPLSLNDGLRVEASPSPTSSTANQAAWPPP